MIRTHLVPETNHVSIAIPDSYIGKKVEVIVFAAADVEQSAPVEGKLGKYKGMLSKERAKEFQEFAGKIRKEWDRDI